MLVSVRLGVYSGRRVADGCENGVRTEDRPQRRFAGQRRRVGGLGGEQRLHVVGMARHDERLDAAHQLHAPHVAELPPCAQMEAQRPLAEALHSIPLLRSHYAGLIGKP